MKSKTVHEQHGERTLAVVLSTGEEAAAALVDLARRQGLSSARFTGIGALSRVTLGFYDLNRQAYRRIPVEEQVEVVSLAGNIALDAGQPKLHAHLVIAKADGAAMGGHLIEAHVRPTLEIVLVESPGHLRRAFDKASGLALLDLS